MSAPASPDSLSVTFVIAAWNEAENLESFIAELGQYFYLFREAPCVLVVDDGSADDTGVILSRMKETRPWLRSLRLPHQGKSRAWQAGFHAVSGEWICTMDADLQNDPADLPLFLAKANTGYDFISGKRGHRQAGLMHIIPSLLGNLLLKGWSGIPLTDHGCGMKLFRKTLVEGLDLPEGMHRVLGILVHARGARVTEVPVNDRPRHAGLSKYTAMRWYVFLRTLMGLRTITRSENPAHR